MGLPVLTDSLQSYLAEINRYPVLAQDEELRVAKRYCASRRLEDAHTLVTANLRYVVKIAFEYRNYGCTIADLIQEGNIGLMVAVKKFDPNKGFRLITYATWWIRSFIQDFIIKTKGIVKRGAKAFKKMLFYKNRRTLDAPDGDGLESAFSRGASSIEYSNDLSLDHQFGDDGLTHLDLLKDAGPGQEEALSEKQEHATARRDVTQALAALSDKERVIVEHRLMSEEPQSLQRLGDKLGLTRERVRQIESTAIKKLQKALSEKKPFNAPFGKFPAEKPRGNDKGSSFNTP